MKIISISEFYEFTSLDKKRSEQLKKEYPHLIAEKSAPNSYEIELGPHKTTLTIDLSKDDIPIHHCSCIHSNKKGYCHHLLFLIDLINQNKIDKSTNTVKTQKKKALPTLKNMLSNIDDDSLRSFVIQYGRKHKTFSIVLKAKLIRSNTHSDHLRNYYLELMNQIVHQRTTPSNPLTIGQLNTFLDVADVYLDEIVSCQEDKDFLNYYYIAFALIDRINLVLFRTPKKASKILPYWITIHQHMAELLVRVDAPDLKDEIIESLILLSSKVYYQFCIYSANIVELILKYTPEKSNLTNYSDDLIATLKHKENSEWEVAHFAAIISLLYEINDKQRLIDFCTNYIHKAHTYIEIAKILETANKSSASSNLLKIGHSLMQNASLHEIYIHYNINKWSQEVLFNELYQHLSMYDSINPIKEVLQTFNYKSAFIKFLKSNKPLPNSKLAKVYKYIQKPKLLLKTLDDIPLGQLQQYDLILWEECPDKTLEYYKLRIEQYLNDFHGNKAAIFVTSILNTIQLKAAHQDFIELLNFIQKKYSHRSGIISMTKNFIRSHF